MALIESRSETISLRGLRYHIRHWGEAGAPRLFFLHGWMDSSPSFQFVVDALQQSWHVIAPDWRGYGASEWQGRPYWFPDYYADLDSLLAHYSPDQPARLVGHSMGGNIASIYAGLKPERVRQLVMLDFLGLKPSGEVDAPTQLSLWLAAVQSQPQPRLRTYPDHAALARRLMLVNPRLREDRAHYLARHVGRVRSDGKVEMACDPWHKIPSPSPYRIDDTLACWRRITAPVLMLVADQGFVQQRFGHTPEEFQRRLGSFADVRLETIRAAGHNLQHDQPEQVAAALEGFLGRD